MPADVCNHINKLYNNVTSLRDIIIKFNKLSWVTVSISMIIMVISLLNISRPDMLPILTFSTVLMIVSLVSFKLNSTNERLYNTVHSVNSVFFVLDCQKNEITPDGIERISIMNDSVKKFVKLFILSFFINIISTIIAFGFIIAIIAHLI